METYPNHKSKVYKYGIQPKGELDLGPAVASLPRNEKLRKTCEKITVKRGESAFKD